MQTKEIKGVSVIVLTWNGLELIKECLPLVVAEVATWTIPHEIIVVDNGSNDATTSYVKETWPEVNVIALPSNVGFSRANNLASLKTRFDTLLFLNNDLTLERGFIDPLLKQLQVPDVFAVCPKIMRWDRQTIDDGLRYGEFYSGLFDTKLVTDSRQVDIPHTVTFFCGACFLCRKDLFYELDMFDEMYTPYAWEDLDLAYRAWKRGYRVVYEPRAVAYHKREATTRSLFSNFFFITLMWRNKFIFMWKNITYKPFISDHLIRLPWKLIKFLCNGRWRYVVGFARALRYLPKILKKRAHEASLIKRSDKDVISKSFAPL